MTTGTKVLIAYSSASGVTRRVARDLAEVVDADLYEITPREQYTSADLDWTDKLARSTVETDDASARPGIVGRVKDMDTYATVFVGYPIWWYTAPRIVNTFLESYDFSEKAVMLFATSGTSGIDKSVDDLRHTYASINFVSGRLLNGSPSVQDLEKWAKGLTG